MDAQRAIRPAQPSDRKYPQCRPEEPANPVTNTTQLPALGWCWELDGKVLSHEATATAIMHALLDRIETDSERRQPGMKWSSDDDDDSFEPD